MDYNRDTLQQVKEAIKDYMTHRFPVKSLTDVVPSFKILAESQQVSAATLSLGNEREHYLRRGIHELLDEGFLLIRRSGEVHAFLGDDRALDVMFLKMNGIEIPLLDKVDYLHLPPHLGFATCVDDSLIWTNYDSDDR